MKKLTLVEYGCAGTGYRNGSDVPNCRVRAEFDTLDGLHVIADFGSYQRHDANKKGCPVVQPNALYVDGTYYDAEGCGRSYEHRLAQTGFDFIRFDFTKAGILAFMNEVTGLDIQFNDLGCFYSGNIRIFGKMVGDYYADSVQEICEAFPHLKEKMNACLN